MIIIKWLLNAFAVISAAYLINGVVVESFWSALWVALFLGLINITLKPVLIVLTLPVNILTLGLFTFVINALMILLASTVIKGFFVSGFWTALLFGLALSILNYLLNQIFKGVRT